jgi:hypothetical protein
MAYLTNPELKHRGFVNISYIVGYILFALSIIGLFISHPWYIGLVCLIFIPTIARLITMFTRGFNNICAYLIWLVPIFNIIWAITHTEIVYAN